MNGNDRLQLIFYGGTVNLRPVAAFDPLIATTKAASTTPPCLRYF
jgi:hypothetical protein